MPDCLSESDFRTLWCSRQERSERAPGVCAGEPRGSSASYDTDAGPTAAAAQPEPARWERTPLMGAAVALVSLVLLAALVAMMAVSAALVSQLV
jgi:hypothetical protein